MIIIDRIEGNVAVCEKEDRTMVDISLADLPEGVKEGDALCEVTGGYIVSHNATEDRKNRVNRLMKDLWK